MIKKRRLIISVLSIILIVFVPSVVFAADVDLNTADSPYDLSANGHVSGDRVRVLANHTVTLTGIAPDGVRLDFLNNTVVTFDNVTITIPVATPGARPAIRLDDGITCTINLVGTSSMTTYENNRSAIRVQFGTVLTINGPGELIATGGNLGAGIGSHNGNPFGNVIINGGTVTAFGGAGGAGIGGGSGTGGGSIVINDGEVYASGGTGAQDLGSGAGGVPTALSIYEPADVFIENQVAGSATPSPSTSYQDLTSAPAGYSVPVSWTYPIGFYGTWDTVTNPQTGQTLWQWLLSLIVS